MVLPTECQQITNHKFPVHVDLLMTVLVCPTYSPKHKDTQFTITEEQVKQQIYTFEELEPVNICPFCLNKCLNSSLIIKI